MKKIMMMLTKSPFGNDENINRLSLAQKEDVIIFAQDAVYSFMGKDMKITELIKQKQEIGVRFFASLADCQARGVNPPSPIKLVDYAQQVDLICECELSM